MEPLSLYVHIPFCVKRCFYCDFNTFAGENALIPAYLDALKAEMLYWAGRTPAGQPLHSIYFGGGTPSLLDGAQVAGLMSEIRRKWQLTDDCEVSLEANPGTLTEQKIEQYLNAGVNRISLGVQSANPDELVLLGRIHTLDEAVSAFAACRQAGVPVINLDFIYGLPGQSLTDWQRTLEFAISLNSEHLSLYSLTIEPGTPFFQQYQSGSLPPLDPDLTGDQYALAMAYLAGQGYEQYEISNWRRSNASACRHNLQYWRNLPYLGIGAGAHGYFQQQRYQNLTQLNPYIERITSQGDAISDSRQIDKSEQMQDEMMLGLRLVEQGVERQAFQSKYSLYPEQVFSREISRLRQRGLLTYDHHQDRLKLTEPAKRVANQVFLEFVGDDQ